MNTNGTISIIIPTYNSAATLPACLESIIDQTYENIEICIIDGASTDDTLSIITTAAKKFNNIKFLSEPDQGIYDAMNKGLDLVTGDWIYFLGSDDELSSNTVILNILNEINKDDIDLIYGNIVGLHTKKQFSSNTLPLVISNGISHQSIIYKKSLFTENGKYDLRFKITADYHFNLKIFLNDKYNKKYIDINIAYFGERGLSSNEYDYTFYSYHYKLVAKNNGLEKLINRTESLDKSVYCCLLLAKEKKNMLFAWRNLMYYLLHKNHLSLSFKILTFFRMLRWSFNNA